MTLVKRKVSRDHQPMLIKLKVREDQSRFVAPNEVTFAEATKEPGSHIWGLWVSEMPVGLLAMINPKEGAVLEEGDDPSAAYIWRLMIGEKHQKKGYGKAALSLAIDQAREWGLPRICLSVVDGPLSALTLYEILGFIRTGRLVEGEIEMSLDT